jgi:hypothetical protein
VKGSRRQLDFGLCSFTKSQFSQLPTYTIAEIVFGRIGSWIQDVQPFAFQIPVLNVDHSSSEEGSSPESFVHPTQDGASFLDTLDVPAQWRTAPSSRQDSISSCGSLLMVMRLYVLISTSTCKNT